MFFRGMKWSNQYNCGDVLVGMSLVNLSSLVPFQSQWGPLQSVRLDSDLDSATYCVTLEM